MGADVETQTKSWAELREILRKRSREDYGSRGVKDTKGTWGPQNQLSRAHWGSQRQKQQSQPLPGSALEPQDICHGCVGWWFCGSPNNRSMWCIWLSCQYLENPFLLWDCLIQPFYGGLHLIMPYLVDMPGKPTLFWRKTKEWIWGRVEVRRGTERNRSRRGFCRDVLHKRTKRRRIPYIHWQFAVLYLFLFH